jgi:hypothetical protein
MLVILTANVTPSLVSHHKDVPSTRTYPPGDGTPPSGLWDHTVRLPGRAAPLGARRASGRTGRSWYSSCRCCWCYRCSGSRSTRCSCCPIGSTTLRISTRLDQGCHQIWPMPSASTGSHRRSSRRCSRERVAVRARSRTIRRQSGSGHM